MQSTSTKGMTYYLILLLEEVPVKRKMKLSADKPKLREAPNRCHLLDERYNKRGPNNDAVLLIQLPNLKFIFLVVCCPRHRFLNFELKIEV